MWYEDVLITALLWFQSVSGLQVIISKELAKLHGCKDKVEAVTKFRSKVKDE
jgi:hypothetical protein